MPIETESSSQPARLLLEEIVAEYAVVDRQLEQLLKDSDRGEWSETATQQVLAHLQKIQELSSAAGAAQGSDPTGTRPETELNQLTNLFHAMLAKIARLEKGAQEARDRLLPQVNVGVRSLQMRRAYSGGIQ